MWTSTFLGNLGVLNMESKLKNDSFYVKKPQNKMAAVHFWEKNIKHISSIIPRHVIPQNEVIWETNLFQALAKLGYFCNF